MIDKARRLKSGLETAQRSNSKLKKRINELEHLVAVKDIQNKMFEKQTELLVKNEQEIDKLKQEKHI